MMAEYMEHSWLRSSDCDRKSEYMGMHLGWQACLSILIDVCKKRHKQKFISKQKDTNKSLFVNKKTQPKVICKQKDTIKSQIVNKKTQLKKLKTKKNTNKSLFANQKTKKKFICKQKDTNKSLGW